MTGTASHDLPAPTGTRSSASSAQTEALDVLIVGGGPAGLSAALLLGRCLRRVLVCDSGQPRNAASHALHGFLTRDGTHPAEFLKIGREQLERYQTVTFRKIKVEHIERGKGLFTSTLEGGEKIMSRIVLLATGVVDELPPLENFRQFYGVSAHNCRYCDGWEHRGEKIAVVGFDKDAVELAIELRLWSKDVILCTNGPGVCDEGSLKLLLRNNVEVIETPIARLEGEGAQLEKVVFTDGSENARRALFFSPGQHQQSPLAQMLGCEFSEADGCVVCAETAATCVPGLYVAGNASRGLQLIIAACAEGTHAGFAINCALVEADAEVGCVKSGAGDEK